MGNKGSWSDTGSVFCFNPAKTWSNGWFSAHHQTVTPSSSAFDGYLAGINAVVDGGIQTGEKVVLQVTGSGETTLYIMYNRKAGPNSGVPSHGDEVTIVSQASLSYSTSSFLDNLSQGQIYTQNNWGSSSNALKVEVCSISTSTPGNARVLIYVDGVNNLSCSTSSTSAPVATPTSSAPVKTPTSSAPVKTPTSSAPVATPTSSAPVKTPSSSAPVATPTTGQCQDVKGKFLYKRNKKKNCAFIGKFNTESRCNLGDSRESCPVTCGTGCQCFDTVGRFKQNNKGKMRSCSWAARKDTVKRCRINKIYTNCPVTCGVC